MKAISPFIFLFLLPLLFSAKSETNNLRISQKSFLNPLKAATQEDYHYAQNNDISDDISNILIRVNLEDNNDTIIIGEEITDKETGSKILPTIAFITDYDDTLNNFFNISDIEENTHFEIHLKEDDQSLSKSAECRLWKPKDEKIRMFCSATFLYGNYTFDEVNFNYKNYNVTIKTEDYFIIKYEIVPINFLYYDKQFIDLDDGNETFTLRFKYDLFINEGLYLNAENNYIPLYDDCQTNKEEKELICQIKKSLIEKNLIKKGNFKLCSFKDYLGTTIMNSVLDININYNDIFNKEMISIIVDYPEILSLKAGENIAYKTNSSSSPNIITDKFNMTFVDISNRTIKKEFSCYLKTSQEQSNLNLLCTITEEGSYLLLPQGKESTTIHYKYKFNVVKIAEDPAPFNVTGKGSQIFLTYPNSVNLTFEESVTLKYLMDEPSLEENILITQNIAATSNDLVTCSNYGKVKMCKVPLNFFEGKNSGFFYTYHSLNTEQTDYAPFYESNPINFILPPNNLIIMRIKYEDNPSNIYIGNKGVIYLKTNYNDTIKNVFNESDISFDTQIKDKEENIYNVNCIIWKPGNENIRILCKLNENLKNENQVIILNTVNFSYKGYDIIILPETDFIVYQRNYDMPFFYAEKQTIELDNGREEYDLRFKFYYYSSEIIYLLDNYFILDNFRIQGRELICTISKKKLEENLKHLGIYKLYYLIDGIEYTLFDSVLGINIKYGNAIKKEDIYVNITNLLTDTYDYKGLATYETISNITSDIETETFSLYFSNNNIQELFTCYFKKRNPNNLLLFCYVSNGNNYTLSKIETRKIFDNIHYKFNFIIEPVENNETINIYDNNVRIYNIYPNNFDFLWQETANIIYFVYEKDSINGLRLAPDLDNLECTSTYWGILNCKISLNYFKNKTTGYFYTYHQDKNGDWQILYEANPIYVRTKNESNIILKINEENNKEAIKVGLNGILYFVVDNETDINFESDIEDFSFSTWVYDEKGNSNYSISCRLWKPENEKIRMFCKLQNSFSSPSTNIILGEVQFTYKNYTVFILSKDAYIVNQLRDNIGFLYAEKQEINIKEGSDSYPIVFNCLTDNYETLYNKHEFKQQLFDNLYLYKNDMRAITLENCEEKDNNLTCNINKNKILEILASSGEKYNLGQKLETEGLYIFNSVLDITFNYDITQTDISIKIGNLLTQIIAKNEFIAYETNKDNMTTLTTDYFELESEKCGKIKCLFKKNNNRNNVLLLCNATADGTYSLGRITSNNFDKININYNFTIEQSENNEEFTVSNDGTKISSLYPLELNFKEKDSYIIKYETENPEKLNGIKLNNNSSSELVCENKIWYKECTVNKNHFSKSGYYYTYHNNNLGSKTISYEAPLINVILEEKKENPEKEEEEGDDSALIISLSVACGIIVLCVIGLLIWYCLRKKNNSNKMSQGKEDLLPIEF